MSVKCFCALQEKKEAQISFEIERKLTGRKSLLNSWYFISPIERDFWRLHTHLHQSSNRRQLSRTITMVSSRAPVWKTTLIDFNAALARFIFFNLAKKTSSRWRCYGRSHCFIDDYFVILVSPFVCLYCTAKIKNRLQVTVQNINLFYVHFFILCH